MKIFIKIFRCLVVIVLGALILLNVIFIVQSVISDSQIPLFFGYGRAVVVTGSMEPAIHVGDMIIIHEKDDYEVGDIILYEAKSFVTHRIVAVTENGVITQGDANNVDDGEILREQIVGKVVLIIPKIGYAANFLKTPFGMLLIILLIVLMIEVPNFINKRLKRR